MVSPTNCYDNQRKRGYLVQAITLPLSDKLRWKSAFLTSRSNWRNRKCCHHYGPDGIPVGARLCGLGWAGTTGGFDWRQTPARPNSKQGDRYLRRILVGGAVSILRRAKLNPQQYPWDHAAASTATVQSCRHCAGQ